MSEETWILICQFAIFVLLAIHAVINLVILRTERELREQQRQLREADREIVRLMRGEPGEYERSEG